MYDWLTTWVPGKSTFERSTKALVLRMSFHRTVRFQRAMCVLLSTY